MMLNRFPRLYTGLAMLLLCFEQLAFSVQKHPVLALDVACSKAIQAGASPFWDHVMSAISIFERWPFAVALALSATTLFYRIEGRRTATYVFFSLVTGLVVNLLAKQIIYRPRPSAALVRVLAESHSSSFPSGTVIIYVVFFGFTTVLCRSSDKLPGMGRRLIMAVCLTLISSIGFARVYLGAHWLSDVLGGYLAGTAVLVPFSMCFLRKENLLAKFKS